MDKGVNLYLEQAVASFSREGKGLKVTFKNGQSILPISLSCQSEYARKPVWHELPN